MLVVFLLCQSLFDLYKFSRDMEAAGGTCAMSQGANTVASTGTEKKGNISLPNAQRGLIRGHGHFGWKRPERQEVECSIRVLWSCSTDEGDGEADVGGR